MAAGPSSGLGRRAVHAEREVRRWRTAREPELTHARSGFAGYEPGSTTGSVKLDKLYVHPRVQGRGYGYALVEHAQACSLERGFSSLYLQVNKGNTASIAFYRKAGFAVRDEVKVDIGNGYFMDDFVMSKRLGDSGE